jgi:hypothetical protein
MTRQDFLSFVAGTEGHIFSLVFVKRTTGEPREMICRTGVRSRLKGGAPAYNAGERGLICVFDMQKDDYRSIPVENVVKVKVSGEWEDVT